MRKDQRVRSPRKLVLTSLILLSAIALIPAHANITADKGVEGSGTGTYVCFVPALGPIVIQFFARFHGGSWSGVYIISQVVQGQFFAVSDGHFTDGVLFDHKSYVLTGPVDIGSQGCGITPPQPPIATISGDCGIGVTITFTSTGGDSGVFNGNVSCKTVK